MNPPAFPASTRKPFALLCPCCLVGNEATGGQRHACSRPKHFVPRGSSSCILYHSQHSHQRARPTEAAARSLSNACMTVRAGTSAGSGCISVWVDLALQCAPAAPRDPTFFARSAHPSFNRPDLSCCMPPRKQHIENRKDRKHRGAASATNRVGRDSLGRGLTDSSVLLLYGTYLGRKCDKPERGHYR